MEQVEVVSGYTTYIDLIKPLIKGKQIISTAMKKEVDRVEAAIDVALGGKSCAIVSSGDPGIYAMAGLALEMCQLKAISVAPASEIGQKDHDGNTLFIEVVPGIPALCSGASLLGAPLTHDFAAISLSDLLTPMDLIKKRVEAAAKADFVIVIYNPKSKKRSRNLEIAQNIILQHRSPDTPVGIVTGAMRDNQDLFITPLKDLHKAKVGMQTTVFIGNSTTTTYGAFLITPRGYAKKYKIGNES